MSFEITGLEWVVLVAGGIAAGVVNTLAGGGSLLTVPLLIFLGLPAPVANGTNRVGVLSQNLTSTWRFRAEGVSGLRAAVPILIPVALGSAVGAVWVARLSAETFERLFGIVMLGLLYPMLRRRPKPEASTQGNDSDADGGSSKPVRSLSPQQLLMFFAIGVYGGAIQAGVGLVLIAALAQSGIDLVRANSIKVVVIAAFTIVAVPVFIAHGQVAWGPALALVAGFAVGGELGARMAVRGGERVIRPVLVLAVVAMAGRLLRLY